MPDHIAGLRVRGQLRLKLPQRFLIGHAQHFVGESLQLYKADGHRENMVIPCISDINSSGASF
ncbi:MAG: hypothetical protein ABI318_03130 [Chthoniobacteraceae bacterium]